MLGSNDRLRLFERQKKLSIVGASGQDRLAQSRVLIAGLGALGCPAAEYLARAGVGSLFLFDPDTVEATNLHRQPLYSLDDIGKKKVFAARDRLQSLGFPTAIMPQPLTFNQAIFSKIESALGRIDLVVDATDSFESRFEIHDLCRKKSLPAVIASVQNFTGQLAFFPNSAKNEPCLRCLFPIQPQDAETRSCADDGILGASAGIMGSFLALHALLFLLGAQHLTAGKLLTIDLRFLETHETQWEKLMNCGHFSASSGKN